MKRWITSALAAATIALAAVPTAQACGGYAQIDPMNTTIQTAITEHFQRARASVRIQRFANLRYDATSAHATVFFVDRRNRMLSQEIRLTIRGSAWAVVGGARPVHVSRV